MCECVFYDEEDFLGYRDGRRVNGMLKYFETQHWDDLFYHDDDGLKERKEAGEFTSWG